MNTIKLHPATVIASSIIVNAIEAGRTLGVDWPKDAEFAVTQRTSTWPCGWSEDTYITFFNTEEEMLASLAHTEEWALCEDNYFARRAYRWDWGPVEMFGHAYRSDYVPTKIGPYAKRAISTANESWKVQAERDAEFQKLKDRAQPLEFTEAQYLRWTDPKNNPGPFQFNQGFEITEPGPTLFLCVPKLKAALAPIVVDEPHPYW